MDFPASGRLLRGASLAQCCALCPGACTESVIPKPGCLSSEVTPDGIADLMFLCPAAEQDAFEGILKLTTSKGYSLGDIVQVWPRGAVVAPACWDEKHRCKCLVGYRPLNNSTGV